jgi:hypothetical protein
LGTLIIIQCKFIGLANTNCKAGALPPIGSQAGAWEPEKPGNFFPD